MKGRTRHGVAALTGLVLGVLALGPGLAPGYLLSFDMVFVPDPSFTRMTFGLTGTVPRHVPSDAFVTALGAVLPGGLAQKAVLLAIFVMACAGAASLVPARRLAPRLAAGVLYAWNPFVAERLLLGHWAFLLGYAALPWVVAASAGVVERHGARRLGRALVPAAIGGFAAMAVSGLAALAVAGWSAGRHERGEGPARGGGRWRAVAWAAGTLALFSLPWLVTGWLRPSGMPGDPGAVDAFAARADTPFGTLGSLLLLGGVWNAEAVPTGYGVPLLAVCSLVVVVASLVMYARAVRTPWARGLAVAAGTGFVLAAFGAYAAPLLKGMIDAWSGFAVLRDGQQYTAPLAVVVAVGFGVLADRLMSAAGAALGVLALVVPVVLLPSLAWGAAGRLEPVQYPAGWARAREVIRADRVAGDVVALPWATYRSYPWNHRRTSLDALPRYLGRRVVTSDAVVIGAATIPAEDPKARRLDAVIKSAGPLTGPLAAAGVRYAAFDAETDPGNPAMARLAGAERVVDGPDLVLYRIPDPVAGPDQAAPAVPAALAWAVWIGLISWCFLPSRTTLATRTSPRLP
ncbi:hypothetical protein [Actinomadura xylanilytica]|uniref:hypothetical protein n=1 Tax=Actinomadura xylanilytica TaxID=887459 RepID=UPI00255AB155|nr:hypothetical protein [Actinomadura xylanilytica]MDL4775968.1 hypothetical protein [Actinomadura xylanilytica]